MNYKILVWSSSPCHSHCLNLVCLVMYWYLCISVLLFVAKHSLSHQKICFLNVFILPFKSIYSYRAFDILHATIKALHSRIPIHPLRPSSNAPPLWSFISPSFQTQSIVEKFLSQYFCIVFTYLQISPNSGKNRNFCHNKRNAH